MKSFFTRFQKLGLIGVPLLVMALQFAVAGEGRKNQVQSFDPSISAKDYGENYEDRGPIKDLPYPSLLAERGHRDQVLKASGVLNIPKYEKMDDLDRDVLFLKAKKHTTAELKKTYPDLPNATLKKLKTEVAK